MEVVDNHTQYTVKSVRHLWLLLAKMSVFNKLTTPQQTGKTQAKLTHAKLAKCCWPYR